MNDIPDRFLFMKVGNHAGETWEQILARKRRELDAAGTIFWGYGGNACHPLSQVQPFARLAVREQGGLCIVMEPIDSKAEPDLVPATEFSRDGITWEPMPRGISVTGSRYALVLDEIKPGELELRLNEFDVAIGPSSGKAAEEYLRFHTDKGCLMRTKKPRAPEKAGRRIVRKVGYTANIKEPFAVLLR